MKNDELRIQVTRKNSFPVLYELNLSEDDSVAMTDEEILAVVKAAAGLGITKIRLTGGDPLEREGIIDLVKQIKAVEGIETVSMTTPGRLMPDMAPDLKDAGLDSVDVRIDTFYQEKYIFMTGGGSIDAAMDGLEACQNLGMKPTRALFTMIEGLNEDEVFDIAQLALNEPIEIVYCEKPESEELKAENSSGQTLEKSLRFMPVEEVKKKFKGAVKMPETDKVVDYIKWFEAQSKIGFMGGEKAREFGPELLADGRLKMFLFDENPVDISAEVRAMDTEKLAERMKEL